MSSQGIKPALSAHICSNSKLSRNRSFSEANIYENENWIHTLHLRFAWKVCLNFSFAPDCLLWIFTHSKRRLERRPKP
jgi:hypothetical protein